MHRIGIVTGIVIVMLIGIGIAGAQTPPHETSTPLALKTPGPTPTPTVTDAVCNELWWLSFRAELTLGSISDEDSKETFKAHAESIDHVTKRLGQVMTFTEETDPLLYRLAKPIWGIYVSRNVSPRARDTFLGDGPSLAFLSARQLERVCAFNKTDIEDKTQFEFEVLVDFGCSTDMALNNHPSTSTANLAPMFGDAFKAFMSMCTSHDHRELHSHSGAW